MYFEGLGGVLERYGCVILFIFRSFPQPCLLDGCDHNVHRPLLGLEGVSNPPLSYHRIVIISPMFNHLPSNLRHPWIELLTHLFNPLFIKGYSVDYGDQYLNKMVIAHVSIKVKQKLTTKTNIELKQVDAISQLYAISGEFDLIAVVQAQNLEKLSHLLDDIGNLDGVERTTSSVILETKFKR